jgi:hypothetical protein
MSPSPMPTSNQCGRKYVSAIPTAVGLHMPNLVELFDMQAQTKSSPVNMRSILDRTKEEIRALEALGCPTQYWNDILVFMTLRRLDSSTRLEWQLDLTNSDKQKKLVDSAYTPASPTFQQLELFLDHRIRALEMSMLGSKPMQSVPNYRSVPVKARVHAVGAASGSPVRRNMRSPAVRPSKDAAPKNEENRNIVCDCVSIV